MQGFFLLVYTIPGAISMLIIRDILVKIDTDFTKISLDFLSQIN